MTTATAPTWIVLIRDLTGTVRVAGEPAVVASMVIDADNGLILGLSAGPTPEQACGEAMHIALTGPPGDLPPSPAPGAVVAGPGWGETVATQLEPLVDTTPTFYEGTVEEAESVFDAAVGHLAGRQQPNDQASTADVDHLMAAALDFWRATPWESRSDAEQLDLVTRVDGVAAHHVAVVLGQTGVASGLVVYPVGAIPEEELAAWIPGQDAPMPVGTLLMLFAGADELPVELVDKAVRHGWPADADRFPGGLTRTDAGPADLGRVDTRRLVLALRAVVAHDTAGIASLEDDRGSFTIGPAR